MSEAETVDQRAPESLRSDARRNRERIVAAAREVFREQGIDVPLDEIARRAGVGNATLYRRFPTRDTLVDAVFADQIDTYVGYAEAALDADDAWEGFTTYLVRVCEALAADRGLNACLSRYFRDAIELESRKRRHFDVLRQVFRRAQEQGSLRADLTPEDMAFVIWSNARIAEATREVAPRAWRRHLGFLLDGFRADNARPVPELPLSPTQLAAAARNLGADYLDGEVGSARGTQRTP